MSAIAQQVASTVLEHFVAAAASVISQIAGTAMEAAPELLLTPTEAATVLRIEVSGALEGLLELAISAPMTAEFSALLTGEPVVADAEVTQDQREAAAELLQQIAGNAADRLRQAFGPTELKASAAEREESSGQHHLVALSRAAAPLEFELHIVRLAERPKPAAEPAPAQAPAPVAASAPVSSGNRNLDLLLDIELGVTLRFGTRQMMLKEILELSSGSVVELDRRVQEPVELLIDGRIVAHGEVVIVGGHYGLRVLQVASQGEKIACLP